MYIKVDMLLKKKIDAPLLWGSLEVSRTLQQSVHLSSSQSKLFSYSHTTSPSNSPPLFFSELQHDLYLYYYSSYLLGCLIPKLQKAATRLHQQELHTPFGKRFSIFLEWSQMSSEQQIQQEPKLNSSTTCTQLADNMLYKAWRISVFSMESADCRRLPLF